MEKVNYKGLIAAVVTPMDKGGNVKTTLIDAYARFLIRRGVKGVFVCGTTGESLLLDTSERKKVAEAWMKFSDELDVFLHIGSTSYVVAKELAKHASEIGVDAISAMGPSFLPPRRVNELVEFNQLIARHAPDTPFYYYHIPNVTGVNINMVDFLKEAGKSIPTLRGLKYTSYNIMEEQECIRLHDNYFDILHGHDELFLSGLTVGATGGIGTSYNLTSPLFDQMIVSFEQNRVKEAADLQFEANAFIHLLLKYENSVVSIKAALNILGVDCGPCRLPLRELSANEMRSFEGELQEFDWL